MTGPRFRLGVDFGTSTTIAVLRRPDGRVQQLLFDGSPLLSSAVLLGVDGRLYTGRDAAHLARSAPERLEPNPKRRIDESSVLLGDGEVPVRDLVAAVLGRVAGEAARVAGPVREVTLTHPANWGTGRRTTLVEAARQAGFDGVELVAEPIAAAAYLVSTHGARLPAGSSVLVYDLGAGTCDVSLLRRRPGGFEQHAAAGLNDLGGLDADAAIVAFLQATYGPLWTDTATRRQLWDEVRSGKEMLSRASGTVIMVPALRKEVPLGREQLEELIRPVLRPSVAMTRSLLADARVAPADVAGLFLVGGSSRIPLVATMLHEALGIAPIVAEQPELVVAEGALHPHDGAPHPQGYAPGRRPGHEWDSAPVSGALSGAVPVSGAPLAAMPVSAGPLAGTPVSAVPSSPGAGFPSAGAPSGDAASGGAPSGGAASGGAASAGSAGPVPGRPRRRSRMRGVLAGVAVGLVIAGGGVVAYQLMRDDETGNETMPQDVAGPGRFDLVRMPDNLCDAVDFAGALGALFETQSGQLTPSLQINAGLGTASCNVKRVHKNGAVVADSAATVAVYSVPDVAIANYRQLVADTAKLNDNPVAVADLGGEAIVFTMKDAPDRLRYSMTFILGAKDDNLVWTLRLTVNRQDGKGWTAAEQQDLRNRVVALSRTALPKAESGLLR